MKGRKNLLMISPVLTHPVDMGNKSKIVSLVKAVESMGFNVYYLVVTKDKSNHAEMKAFWGERLLGLDFKYRKKINFYFNKIIRELQLFLGFKNIKPFTIDEWYDDNLDKYIENLKRKISFDVVMVEYAFLSKAFKCFDDSILKILDTHDVFSGREKKLLKNGIKHLGFFTAEEEEKKALDRADVILAIQDEEKAFFSRLASKRIVTIGHITPIIRFNHGRKDTSNILFIGGNSAINKQGLKYFINEVFPLVKAKIDNVKLLVAGDVRVEMSNENIDYLGRVDNLEELYKKADIVINPVLTGTGQKIKSMEALGAGMPLVTTRAGACGLEDGINSAFLVSESSHDFAEKIINLFFDESLSLELSRNAYKYVEAKNEINMERMLSIFNSVLSTS